MIDMNSCPLILDTAALLAWPLIELSGSITLPECLNELENLSFDRHMLLTSQIDSLNLILERPNLASQQAAKEAAIFTGDMNRLSNVDFGILGLLIEHQGILVSDDYSLQNVAIFLRYQVRGVMQKKISSRWSWERKCIGCRKIIVETNMQVCDVCGSEIKIRRKKN